ncbi:Hsp33 family molecular chaperone HslO [Brevibacillus choshinensis]|uniref:Hsp33 family molecular chaperone HslO n=1 Tax=Brevibacillus choshinensis TaxID=54911 RepID=UPI002E1C89A2|nr:Hsp33 family molecular chaperone HslO [Brevibacillus choshinensis]MED4586623.1 Hsp33 family molecular chaperone HslO [Brevibacillus choshinensis]MED4754883.1 Hsp33 family molecular chaperone HslO [Brevibacillus choshinensis]MED4781251.1 Hsp33 family molecular chaperone HslO [Brevibacillus choshinensis]
MSDYLIRATGFNGHVRAFAARTTTIVEEVRRRHDMWNTATAAAGRTLTVSLMMGAMLKGDESIYVKVKGGGPIGQIIAEANSHGEGVAYVTNPHVHFDLNEKGKLDVRRAVGTDGFVYVTKDLGLKEPYQGSSPIVSGEIGEDFTYYFVTSEQTPSAVGVGVLVNPEDRSVLAAGGFIIQLLPNTPEEVVAKMEERLSGLPQVSRMIGEGLSPEEILAKVLDEPKFLSRTEINFTCKCSSDKVIQALISLGREEMQSMIDEQGEAEVHCHFCNERYHYDKSALEDLMKDM